MEEVGEGVEGSTSPSDDLAPAVAAYNSVAEQSGWPTCQRVTPKRRAALKARIHEAGGLEGWQFAMAKARASPFLRGESGRTGEHANWRPDIDFLIKPDKFTKLMEGGYDRRENNGSGPAPRGGKPVISDAVAAATIAAVEAREGRRMAEGWDLAAGREGEGY